MKLAIFDFDGTLFPKDTLPFLLSQAKELNCSRFKGYGIYLSMIPLFIKYKLEIVTKLSREEMKLLAVKKFNHLFKGMTEQELITFFSLCSVKAQPLLNKSVVQEVEKAQREGFHTVLLSGNYDYLLKCIGEQLKFDTVIGTKMQFKNGMFDPDIDLEVVIGGRKLEKVYAHFSGRNINWEGSMAYADGYSDLDLLRAVGCPIAVNPDAKLKMIASEKKWKVIK